MKESIYINPSWYKGLLFLSVCLFASLFVNAQTITVRGKVINTDGVSIAGATVAIEGVQNGAITDNNGIFVLGKVNPDASLIISSIGYEKQVVTLHGEKKVKIVLKKKNNKLDQTVIIAYGTTTERLNTGNISTVTAREIQQQPVSNPLAALEGRVPGLIVTQTSGVPGASFKLQIRGRNSIMQGSDPLIIIDGVPYAPGNTSVSQMISAATPNGTLLGLSPLNSISPGDIESIEVLKDADATAIYGSRGANGVILITTKKGKPGKTTFNANIYAGVSKVTRTINMLNTKEYLQMRREAFNNDGVIPTTSNAPDLLIWDTSRYTNFEKLLIGGTAHTMNAQMSMSGGDRNTQFYIKGSYNHATTVFPGNMEDGRASVNASLSHHTENNRFNATLSTIYSSDVNNLISNNLAADIDLPPDLPPLYDSTGELNWQEGGATFYNPMAYLLDTYKAQTNNLLSHLQLDYNVLPGLSLKTSLGYNSVQVNETSLIPAAAQNPLYHPEGYSQFGNSAVTSWIVEPQAEFATNIHKGRLKIIAGMTFQQILNKSTLIEASGYTNDHLLKSADAASSIQAHNNFSEYRYNAIFGRVNYNWDNKLIVNISGRRDGSSRFGPGKQFANFAAIGVAWIFSNSNFIRNYLPFISFGKLRSSYGITGNDEIGNYQYLDRWNVTNLPYQGTPGITPTALFNPDYGWEINRKLEGAVQLGFLQDRIMTTISYFRNRSSNQLIQYQLPSQTGFKSIIKNFPALVQNTGLEWTLSVKVISTKDFSWTSSINMTIPRNKLLAFPGIANSSYFYKYVIGQSLNVLYKYRYLGVDPSTGLYHFKDINKDGIISSADFLVNGSLDPKFYGGFNNSLSYKGLRLNFFFQFKKQIGQNYRNNLNTPGTMYNQPKEVLTRWEKPGDKANVQQFSQGFGLPYQAQYYLTASNGIYGDASFIRLKNISLSYNLPDSWIKPVHLISCRIYGEGQNVLTITRYKGADPETQNMFSLPPLRSFVIGLQLTF